MRWFGRKTEAPIQAGKPSRLELARQARKLRERGMVGDEIAAAMGISRSYVYSLISDPDGSKDRARKQSYGGTCERCGGRTDGGNGRHKAPRFCLKCAPDAYRYWTRERVIKAIQRFAAENGRPPIATEWLYGAHGRNGDGYPHVPTVQALFGSWANAVEAAGFQRPTVGHNFNGNKNVHRVTTEELIGRIRDAAEIVLLAPSSGSPEMRGTIQTLAARGINWEQACEMAGCRPRRKSRTKATA